MLRVNDHTGEVKREVVSRATQAHRHTNNAIDYKLELPCRCVKSDTVLTGSTIYVCVCMSARVRARARNKPHVSMLPLKLLGNEYHVISIS